MSIIGTILSTPSILKGLGAAFKNLFLGTFLMKTGADKQQLNDMKREQKNVAETKKVTDHVDSMSESDLNELF